MVDSSKINNLLNDLFRSGWFNFELTNYCNIRCYYCDNKDLNRKGYMSLPDFQAVVDRLVSVDGFSLKEAIFCGYGEPFLNKYIYDMIDYITNLGIKLTIQSNGKWHLREERIESLFKVDRLSVTIDGVTNKVYNLSRPDTDVNKIFSNLERVIELRQQHGMRNPLITAKMNVFAFNKHETHDFINKCQKLGIDQICLAKGFGPPDIMTTINRMDYNQYAGLAFSVEESLFNSGYEECPKDAVTQELLFENKASAVDFAVEKTGHRQLRELIKVNPHRLFELIGCLNTATIKWDGTLLPCCWDFDFHIPLGNIVHNSIEEILSAKNLDEVGRKVLKSRNDVFSKIPCLSCPSFSKYFEPGFPLRIKKIIKKLIGRA